MLPAHAASAHNAADGFEQIGSILHDASDEQVSVIVNSDALLHYWD